jgi:hypothetical protein
VTHFNSRSFTEFTLRLFTSFRVTTEGFRMIPIECHSEQREEFFFLRQLDG